MKRFQILAAIVTVFMVVAVSQSEANVIKEEVTYSLVISDSEDAFNGAIATIKISDMEIPVAFELFDMKPCRTEFIVNSLPSGERWRNLVRDRSPPNIRYLS